MAVGKLGLLVKVQVLGLFGINRLVHGDAKGGRLRIAVMLLGALVLAGFFAFYTYGMACSLVQVGAVDAIPVLAVAMGGLVGIGVAFLKANGQLFGFADFDLVMSMPVPTWQVVVSRIASLYGMNLVFALLLMVPMLGVYLVYSSAGVLSWAVAVVLVLLAPALPMAVAVVVAYAIAALAARMRYAKVAMGVLTLLLVVAAVIGCAVWGGAAPAGTSGMQELGRLGDQLSELVGSVYPPALWAGRVLAAGDGVAGGLFVLVSVVPLVVVVALMARWFLAINAALATGGATRGRVGGRVLRARSPFAALVGKELRLLVNTPVYLTNTVVGPLLAVVASIGIVVAGPQVLTGAVNVDLPPEALGALEAHVMALLPWVLALCMAMCSTSASALSLEGAHRWIMQTIPVSSRTIVGAKAATNLVLCVPACVVAGGIAAVGLHAHALQAIVFVGVPLAGTLFASACGVFLDARAPRYDWTTPYEVVKRSVSVMITLFAGMLLMVAGGAATMLLPGATGLGWLTSEGISLGCALVIALLAAVLMRLASKVNLQDA